MTSPSPSSNDLSSSSKIDYSTRQNKTIERLIVVNGLRAVTEALRLQDLVYVGLGSVWFSDFHLSHRQLRVDTMISIESDPVIATRARFNQPYRTLEVFEGNSYDVIPNLLKRPNLCDRPWIVWLDYDKAMDESRAREVRDLLSDLPDNSFLIVTFSATRGQYAKSPVNRQGYLEDLFGRAVPPSISLDILKEEFPFAMMLGQVVEDWMVSTSISSGRDPQYQPAFRVVYRDGTPMVTVGGFLSDKSNLPVAKSVIGNPVWAGRINAPVATPPLTAKEVITLRALLPSPAPLTRSDVIDAGFDLEEHQVRAFQDHYQHYPSFAQVMQ